MAAQEELKQIQDGFARLVGRAATNREIADLYRIKDALGLRPNDDLWLILYALQHYQSLYEKIPEKIDDAARRVERAAELVANARFGQSRASMGTPALSRRRLAAIVVGLAVLLVMAFSIGRLSVPAPAREIASLNNGADRLLNCFDGMGRIAKAADGKTYCYPVSTKGDVLGFVIR